MFGELIKPVEAREGNFLIYNSDTEKFIFMATIDYDGSYHLTSDTKEINNFLEDIGLDELTSLRGAEVLEDDIAHHKSTHCYFLEA